VIPSGGIEFVVDPLDQIWVYATGAAAVIEFGNAQKATGDPITVPASEDRSISEMGTAGISFVRIRNEDNGSPATISCILIGKVS
jgi:hypothetical protein